jgi:hypothetical protein
MFGPFEVPAGAGFDIALAAVERPGVVMTVWDLSLNVSSAVGGIGVAVCGILVAYVGAVSAGAIRRGPFPVGR